MAKLSWEKDSLRRRLQKLDSPNWEQRKSRTIPDLLNDQFERAIKKNVGGAGYNAAWSMRRHYLLRGWLSAKQASYLKFLADGPDPMKRC